MWWLDYYLRQPRWDFQLHLWENVVGSKNHSLITEVFSLEIEWHDAFRYLLKSWIVPTILVNIDTNTGSVRYFTSVPPLSIQVLGVDYEKICWRSSIMGWIPS